MVKEITNGKFFFIDTIHPEDIFIPEDMDVNQKLIAKLVEEFMRGEVEPRMKELEAKKEGLMVELIRKWGAMGWLGMDIPKEFGGMKTDSTTSLLVNEKISIGGPFAITNLAHTAFGTLPILYFGNSEQKQRYLPDLAKGKKIGAFALTEPDAGTDALNAKTIAVPSEDGLYYILNGGKQFISNSGYADVFITFAKFNGENFSAFIIDRDCKGLTFGEEEDKMGIHGASTRSLTLENVKIPVQYLLFQIGKGHTVAFNTLNIGRHKLSGLCIGLAKLAFEDSIRYAKSRIQFGQSISNFGLIKEKIGEMAIRIFVGESMVYRTSRTLEERLKSIGIISNETSFELATGIEEFAAECSINKVYASEMLNYIADEAVQIHGGYGFMKDYPIERYYRDSRIYRIFGGTNEINRLLIVRMVLRSATRGQLNLIIEAMEKVASEMGETLNEVHPKKKGLEELAHLVENAKKIVLLSLRVACKAYPTNLEDYQEIMGMIANIIIEVFAMESSLLRTQKINHKWGEEKGEIPTLISQVYILDAFMRVERWAKLLLAAVAGEDLQRNQMEDLKRLTQYTLVDSVTFRRKIADFMLKARRYFIL
jgi:alkylation response protein AidB-like acyl-CoA dehydrogenase